MRYLIAVTILLPVLSVAQSPKGAAPSKEEISELLTKAEEKVSYFEDAVKGVKPILEGQQTDMVSKATNAAGAAHTLIRGIRRNGPSAYGLVGLIATLDDISLNASKAAAIVVLASGTKFDGETQAKLTMLWTAQNSCSDISELILHATLRLIQVEEGILDRLSADAK